MLTSRPKIDQTVQGLVVSIGFQVTRGPGAQVDTHENKDAVQISVFLLEVAVVFIHFTLELVVELDSGVIPGPGASKHRLQGISEGIFQPFAIQSGIARSQFNGYLRFFVQLTRLLYHPGIAVGMRMEEVARGGGR